MILQYEIEDLKILINKLVEEGMKDGENTGKKKKTMSFMDPHKICSLESEQKNIKEELANQKILINEIEKVNFK